MKKSSLPVGLSLSLSMLRDGSWRAKMETKAVSFSADDDCPVEAMRRLYLDLPHGYYREAIAYIMEKAKPFLLEMNFSDNVPGAR